MSVAHAELVDALTRERWERVNRELIAKLLTELAFEDVIAPACSDLGDGRRACVLALGERLVLRYEARRRPLGDWRAEADTIAATLDGADVALPDAADVVAIGAPAIGADAATSAGLVGEVAATALARRPRRRPRAPRRRAAGPRRARARMPAARAPVDRREQGPRRLRRGRPARLRARGRAAA